MFNWSWNLREQNEYLRPVGPKFNLAPLLQVSINGSRISIRLPRQNTTLPDDSFTLKGSHNIKDLESALQEYNCFRYRFSGVFSRTWDFNGPWFTGRRGTITVTATIISPAVFSDGLNYFHPRALEAAIAEYLTAWYGNHYSADLSKQEWFAPDNWQQLQQFPCIAARFDAKNIVVKKNGPHCYLVAPLAKTHYIVFKCAIDRHVVLTSKTPKPTIDEWIDLEPFTTLANQVLDSIKVELSPQALAEQEEALRGLSEEEKQLVKEYPPLKWTPPAREVDENWREKYSNN